MKRLRFLPAALLVSWLFTGCQSNEHITFTSSPRWPALAVADQQAPISTTNVYYPIDRGPGCAIFIPESIHDFFGGGEGKRVVVVDGHFPPPAERPKQTAMAAAHDFPWLDYSRQDMSLIDDTGGK